MISNENISNTANQIINAGNLTDLELIQLSAINKFSENAKLVVETVSDLPSASLNKGRFIYVSGEEKYYYSTGVEWSQDQDTKYSYSGIFYGFGYNNNGQLGDNTTTNRSSPVTVVGGITNWSQVSGGLQHSLGLTSTGIAYAWGLNSNGRLGDGTTINRSSPVTVVGAITNWSQLSAGDYHSLGLTSTGIAYAWGQNVRGQLADGTTISRSSPVTVVGAITNWSQLSGGQDHSLGVTTTGIAYAWGAASSGRLGDGTTISKSSPVTVVGGITNWSQVSGGGSHSLGLTSTGIAYAWGSNGSGRLGDGTTTDRSSPVTVVGGITNWSQVSGGREHSLGVTSSGIAYGWGNNEFGRLGDGTTINRSSPVTVVGGITNWSQVSGGLAHSLGLTSTGIAYAWGYANNGRLGDGDTISRSSPVTVVGGITNWSQVDAGFDHSLGISADEQGINI
jgi:alpha-tubulin suppressor-like RCC1 family protein